MILYKIQSKHIASIWHQSLSLEKMLKEFVKIFKSNQFFLEIFLVLLSIFCALRSPVVAFDDAWYHMTLSQELIRTGFLEDYSEYYGKLTYHFLGASFSLMSGFGIEILAKFIGLFQLPLGCLLFYTITRRISKNKNISIITTILFTITIFGTILNLSQYWPTALTTFFGLELYHQYIQRLKKIPSPSFLPIEETWKFISIKAMLILAITFTHVINALIYLTPLIFIEFFLIIRDKNFKWDFISSLVLAGTSLLLNPYSRYVLSNINIPTNPLIFLAILPIVFVFILIEKFIHRYTFSTKNPTPKFFDPENTTIIFEKKYYFKFLIPALILIGPIVYIVLIIREKGFFPSNIGISVIETIIIAILCSASIIGFSLYRNYSLVGKSNFLYMICIVGLILSSIVLSIIPSFIIRMIEIFVPFIFIGVGRYFFYNQSRILLKKRNRKVLTVFCAINLISSISYQTLFADYISSSDRGFIEKFAYYSSDFDLNYDESPQKLADDQSIVTGNFHWAYPFGFYGNNSVIQFDHEIGYYLLPENHTKMTSNGTEIIRLRAYQSRNNYTNMYLILGDIDLTRGLIYLDGGNFGLLDDNDFDFTNNAVYLNRIGVANHQKSIFWVIS
ncbi:hypothetical protein [Candidatus Lokiarchaeum ossiferum]